MMRYIYLLSILLFLACSREENAKVKQLNDQMSNITDLRNANMDSMISVAKDLPSDEQYAIICRTIIVYKKFNKKDIAEQYIEKLLQVPFPKITNKTIGFMLMEVYSLGVIPIEDIDIEGLSSIFFYMENKLNLTPKEKFRYLCLKATVYCLSFREYGSAIQITKEAQDLATQYNFKGDDIMSLYNTHLKCYLSMQDTKAAILLTHERLNSAEKYGLDQDQIKSLHKWLSHLYYKQEEYDNAYRYLDKSANSSDQYSEQYAKILCYTDRAAEGLAYIDRSDSIYNQRYSSGVITEHVLHIWLGKLEWMRANIYLRQGNLDKYEQHLKEAIHHYELGPKRNTDIEHGLLSETYARYMWDKGNHKEAIKKLEQLTAILSEASFYDRLNFSTSEKRLRRIKLLAEYYHKENRLIEAQNQFLIYDSLNAIYKNKLIDFERNKNTNRIYTEELQKSLSYRTAIYQKEKYRLIITVIILLCTAAAATTFYILYRNRKREINNIYARQKGIEQMEQTLIIKTDDDIPADRQLYLRLEQQMADEKLFLNPDVSRDDLCRMIGSNRMYVSTCINKYSGMNLNQWINKARVNYAIKLIKLGETSLSKLATNSGFSSSSAFYRNFKEVTLLTPKQYIERVIKDKDIRS